jgi:hypothetical protein
MAASVARQGNHKTGTNRGFRLKLGLVRDDVAMWEWAN